MEPIWNLIKAPCYTNLYVILVIVLVLAIWGCYSIEGTKIFGFKFLELELFLPIVSMMTYTEDTCDQE